MAGSDWNRHSDQNLWAYTDTVKIIVCFPTESTDLCVCVEGGGGLTVEADIA